MQRVKGRRVCELRRNKEFAFYWVMGSWVKKLSDLIILYLNIYILQLWKGDCGGKEGMLQGLVTGR